MNPVTFFWEHLGRLLLPPAETTGDAYRDAARALSRTYDHALSDADRVMVKLRYVREQLERLDTWAAEVAKYRAGHEVLELRGNELAHEEQKKLAVACKQVKQPKAKMQGLRLGSHMLAVVTEEPVLLSNVRPAVNGFDHRLQTGMAGYNALLHETIVSPPQDHFELIVFDRAVTTPDDLVLNVPPSRGDIGRIRISGPGGGMVDRGGFIAATKLATGIEWGTIDKLKQLSDQRDINIERAEEIDAKLDALAAGIVVDVYDLLDVLPPRGSIAWWLLRTALTTHEQEDGQDGDTDE